MKQLSKCQKFFTQFDMFSAPPILRARKQPDTSSYASGILSFLLGLFFVYVFIFKTVEVVTYKQIKSVQTQSKLNGDQPQADDVFFGINVGYLDMNQSLALFDIEVLAQVNGSDIAIPLSPCTPNQWQSLGQQYETQFSRYGLKKFLCPISMEYLKIRKTYYAPGSTNLRIAVKPCTSGAYCNTNMTDQLRLVKELEQIQGSIFMTVYFLDSLLSPKEKQIISKTINTDTEFSFTMKRGIIGTIELGTYRVNTDIGYLPISENEVVEANFMYSFRETSFEITNDTSNYTYIYITMNRKLISIERSVGKFDEMLSYAGGLFSIIVGFLKVFMFSYNQYRYELMVAEGITQNDDNGNVIREKDLNFFKYIKYTIFDWVHVLFCRRINWEDCKLIDQARQQANSMLDVTNLFKKIKSFENCLQHLLDQNQKDCLFLVKPKSLNQSKRDRLILEYYSVIMNDEASLTIQEYQNAQSLYHFALKIEQKSFATVRQLKSINEINSHRVIRFGRHMTRVIDLNSQEEQTTEKILQSFDSLASEVKCIKLDPEMEYVQNQLIEAYFSLNSQTKQKIEKHIPIKILIRFHFKYRELKKQQEQQSSSNIYKFETVQFN